MTEQIFPSFAGNGFAGNQADTSFNWHQIIAQAQFQGEHEFATTFLHNDGISDSQLQVKTKQFERHSNEMLEQAKRNQNNAIPLFLSSARKWSRYKACSALRDKHAGKLGKDYYTAFQQELNDAITDRITELELAWAEEEKKRQAEEQKRQEEEQKRQQQLAAARKAEQQQAFEADHPYVINAYQELRQAYTGRDVATKGGYEIADRLATKLEDRIDKHGAFVEHMGDAVLGLVQDVHGQQQRNNKVSLADNVIRVGKDSLTCLFWLVMGGLAIFIGIFAALYFAFPHH